MINDLFKGRVSELEASEQEARKEVEALKREVERLKRGSAEVDADNTSRDTQDEERAAKKAKLNDDNHDNENGEAGFAEFTRGDDSTHEAAQEPETTEAKQ